MNAKPPRAIPTSDALYVFRGAYLEGNVIESDFVGNLHSR